MEGIFYILTLLPLFLKCVPIVFVFLCKFQRYDASKPVTWKTPSKSEMLLIINLKKTRRIKMFRWVRCCFFSAKEKKPQWLQKKPHTQKKSHHLKRSADNASTLWCEAMSERVGGSSLRKKPFRELNPLAWRCYTCRVNCGFDNAAVFVVFLKLGKSYKDTKIRL